MNVKARTPSKVRELKQKATAIRQTTSDVVPKHVQMPFKVGDHLTKERKFVGKSRGSGRGKNNKGYFKYAVKLISGKETIKFDGSMTFNKPQLPGKLLTVGKRVYRIIKKYNERTDSNQYSYPYGHTGCKFC
jgi:hypothetical protein